MTISISDLNNELSTITNTQYRNVVLEYAQILNSKGLPIIFSTVHLAQLIGVTPFRLFDVINNNDHYYTSYAIRKKHGGYRWILSPKEPLKQIQKWIKVNVLDIISISDSAHGFLKERSISSNAKSHTNKEMILNVDLYRFFDTISIKRVFGLFVKLGYIENLAWDLAKLLCAKPHYNYWKSILEERIITISAADVDTYILPQGSPASPAISNILCYRLDFKFTNLANKLNCDYSRYADDLTFSGNRESIPSMNTINKIIKSEGFYINDKKVKYIPKNMRQYVTGTVVNGGVKVLRSKKRMIATHLFFCRKYGVKDHLDYLKNKGEYNDNSNYKQWLWGNICFVKSVEPDRAERMITDFNEINWEL